MFKEKDLDTDGAMSYEEFIGKDTKMALAFKAIDKNGDGYLSKTEFRKICPNMTEEQVENAFTKFDKDKTGRINFNEFCSMLKKKKWMNIFHYLFVFKADKYWFCENDVISELFKRGRVRVCLS